MRAYYNENDKHAAAWLRELIRAGHITDGVVDERSIHDVQPQDLCGFTRCHFFAGIGGWDYALQLANCPADKPVWTGSCPCPPFSSAGKKKRCPECDEKPIPHPLKTSVFACIECGHEWHADDRHLWPEFLRLIRGYQEQVGPTPAIFGEQVAGPDGLVWFDGVRATLEALGLAVAGSDLCSAGINAPHIRQRLYWVADGSGVQRVEAQPEIGSGSSAGSGIDDRGLGDTNYNGCRATGGGSVQAGVRELKRASGMPCGLADAELQHAGAGVQGVQGEPTEHGGHLPPINSVTGVAQGDTIEPGPQGHAEHGDDGNQPGRIGTSEARPATKASRNSFDLVRCVEPTKEPGRYVEKWRRVEPGTLPLAHGIPGRVGLLRGYGNAIDPELAAQFIIASGEVI